MGNEITKTIRLSPKMWNEINDVRFVNRFKSEAETLRAIVAAGLDQLSAKQSNKKGKSQ